MCLPHWWSRAQARPDHRPQPTAHSPQRRSKQVAWGDGRNGASFFPISVRLVSAQPRRRPLLSHRQIRLPLTFYCPATRNPRTQRTPAHTIHPPVGPSHEAAFVRQNRLPAYYILTFHLFFFFLFLFCPSALLCQGPVSPRSAPSAALPSKHAAESRRSAA
jgi:hypothetical protein